MVTVLVDNNQIAFNVHMKPLVRKSSYFRKSLAAHQWMDDKVALIKLPHVSAFYFKHYSHWINQDRLHFEAFDYSLDRYPPFLSIIRADQFDLLGCRIQCFILHLYHFNVDGVFLCVCMQCASSFFNYTHSEVLTWIVYHETPDTRDAGSCG